MKNITKKSLGILSGVSLIALTFASGATAQATPQAASEDEGEVVVVVGVRKAEQSAVNRKKKAATNQDSIVADDVGQFPDKNAAESIARIAGVALDISDGGEQSGFTIRGQTADLIRIEVDGMTTLDNTGGQTGRSSQLNELSSDLIKSVDVVKGQTADMTPGGVGGTVKIEQRSGLDFKDPVYKANIQWQSNSLNPGWSPRINLFGTRKFLDKRLGVLFNITYDDTQQTTDFARVSERFAGYIPIGDHDNSAEKSFVTPYDPLAAAVTTKAGCAALGTPPASPQNSRLNCYAQWEDFLPSLPRFGRGDRKDERVSVQLRADYRLNDNITIFLSYNPNLRKISSQDYNLSIATPTGQTNTSGVLSTNVRNVVVNANHYATRYDMVASTTTPLPVGFVSSLNYNTQVRDIQRNQQQHYLQAGSDFSFGQWSGKARAQYSYAISEREDRAFSFLAPIPSATFSLIPQNGLWTFTPPSSVDLMSPQSYYPRNSTSTGLSSNSQYEYTPQADESSETNYQLDLTRRFDKFGPLKTVKFGIQQREFKNTSWREGGFSISPGVVVSRARSLDQIRSCDSTLVTTCVFGSTSPNATSLTSADRLYKNHTLTTAQYQSLINSSIMTIPGNNFMDGLPDRGELLNSWVAFDSKKLLANLGQYANLSDHSLDCLYRCIASDGKVYEKPTFKTNEKTTSAYIMSDFETRLLGMEVLGNIGVRYQKIDVLAKPVVVFQDRLAVPKVTADGPPLPGYKFQDNFILRREGNVDRTSEDVLPSFNLAVWPIEDELVVRYTIAKQRARPSLVQLTGTASNTCNNVSDADRATLEAFLSANPGAITDSDPLTDDSAEASNFLNSFVNRCSGRIGNPELKGYEAMTENISLEWYPNKDTLVSLTAYKIDIKTGRPVPRTLTNYELEGKSYTVDTWEDGQGGLETKGIELAGRTAFSFLPSFLKNSGGGFNYSTAESTGNNQSTPYDPLTGKILPPRGESSYYYNINLWYDDGKTNARIAYQARDFYFDRFDAESVNRVPESPGISSTATAYFKVVTPVFKTKTESLDARASYKISPKVQLFIEGKNLLDDEITRYAPEEYRKIGGGTPYVFDTIFYGRKYYAGLIYTF